jgi:hypothetical protein
MPVCPVCKKRIRGQNRTKVKGVWMHKHTSIKKPHEPPVRPEPVQPVKKVLLAIYRKGDRRRAKGKKR